MWARCRVLPSVEYAEAYMLRDRVMFITFFVLVIWILVQFGPKTMHKNSRDRYT